MDIVMEDGDTLTIPRRPEFVIVAGQVYSPNALVYTAGKDAGWYLQNAGGTTRVGNRKDAFIVRFDGSVLGRGGIFSAKVLSTRMMPGDALVIPEKISGGSSIWKGLLSLSQALSSGGIVAALVTH